MPAFRQRHVEASRRLDLPDHQLLQRWRAAQEHEVATRGELPRQFGLDGVETRAGRHREQLVKFAAEQRSCAVAGIDKRRVPVALVKKQDLRDERLQSAVQSGRGLQAVLHAPHVVQVRPRTRQRFGARRKGQRRAAIAVEQRAFHAANVGVRGRSASTHRDDSQDHGLQYPDPKGSGHRHADRADRDGRRGGGVRRRSSSSPAAVVPAGTRPSRTNRTRSSRRPSAAARCLQRSHS